MTRKDSEKDSERPHYYSQFWLDIAAGRRNIGDKLGEGESGESEASESPAPRKPGRASDEDIPAAADGYGAGSIHIAAESEPVEEYVSPATEDEDNSVEVDTIAPPPEFEVPDMDLDADEEDEAEESEAEESDEEDEEFLDEEEEEDDEDLEWGRKGKKAKPIRPVKPVSKKPGGKRDIRRY
jgi:hypothetical protein